MQRLMVILSFAGVLALTGCTTAREHHNVRQLDASTYEIEVTQPWEKQEVRVRERSYELAQRICEEQKSAADRFPSGKRRWRMDSFHFPLRRFC